jgi:hypothetical protein
MSQSTEYVQLQPGTALPTIAGISRPFRAVLIIEAAVLPEWQNCVSDWLVQSGCLYMMAWGENCSSWDDSVDWANIHQFQPSGIPDNRFVMTTWQEEDAMEEVFWFAKNSACHPTVELERTVLVHISSRNRQTELLKAYAGA